MKVFAVAALLLVGCASSNGPSKTDGGGTGLMICPAHPENCGGKCCGSTCVNVDIDPLNCGDCGVQCGPGQLCQAGNCGCAPSGVACGMGQSCCNGVGCKSLASDINNCGACGRSCGPGGTCMSGQCTCGSMTCAANEVCCGGSCQTSCVTDMGTALDLSSSSGLCQCADHCASDLIGWCVGTNCCYVDGIAGSCQVSTTCQINMSP
jgi:hypothetical protein